ncbi:hypothetical protein HHK36_032361 [Tetracentron sinense]|uniref:SHSP domain-containing protein n=1 Tax=Tetracentron sinense TaxID=13715 RepID=A0A835CXP2_TETSI|nr:hypothetical protein HHK36_032361 [Tetracentron sinense]
MSSSVSNLNLSLPFSSKRSLSSKSPCIGFPPLLKPVGRCYFNSIKAMVGEERRDNLDELQRVRKQLPQQKQRVSQVAAPIGLWDRFPTARTVQQMMETMDRMMEDPYAYSSSWPSASQGEGSAYGRGRTPWEIKEGEGEYKLRFDMPGMTKNDVKMWIEEKMLVVKAEKVPKKKNQDGQEDVHEEEEWSAKSYGRYNSRIALPENVEFEKIKAEVQDGVLYITIPKASNSSKIFDIDVQ